LARPRPRVVTASPSCASSSASASGDGLADTITAGIVRELARDIEALNQRIADLDAQIAALLDEHGNPVADLLGAGNQIAATLIAHAGDVRRFRNAAAFARFCGAAPIPCGLA
jgi:transposase